MLNFYCREHPGREGYQTWSKARGCKESSPKKKKRKKKQICRRWQYAEENDTVYPYRRLKTYGWYDEEKRHELQCLLKVQEEERAQQR